MKKYILALLYLIFSSVLLFSQDSINQIDKKERKQGYWKKYDKETLLYEGLFKDDVPVGIFKYYYADGKLKSTTDFINGTHKVKTQLFHVNGKKSAEGEFIDQQKNGTWYYYSPQEILIKQENYKNGIPNGLWITFSSETAKKLLEENYDNGVLNGLQIRYYTTGDTMNIIPYINGKRNGFAKTFYTGNIVSSNGLYHNDLYNKTWKYFNDKGEIRKEDNYDEMGKKMETFYYFYNTIGQRLKKQAIVCVKNEGNRVKIYLKSGKNLTFTDSFSEIAYWLSDEEFIAVTPSLIVAYSALKSYKEKADGSLELFIQPNTDFPIIVQDKMDDMIGEKIEYVKLVKSLFNREKPMLER